MKTISLHTLTLLNFKGIKAISIPFTDETEIHGKNGIGKTTISDAYSWLLYGKNSNDETDFSIKTFDSSNKTIHKLDHEVEGIFTIDGEEVRLKKTLREKWSTKRGNDFEELTGHETNHFINDVPVSAGDYKKKVSEIIDESISKIITNPKFFNEKMKWTERREALSVMAGEVSNSEILDSIDKKDELILILNAGKSLADEKKIISVKKKQIKDELEQIPPRIDEISRSKPEKLDFDSLKTELVSIEKQIETKESELNDVSKNLQAQKDEIFRIEQVKFQKEQQLNDLSKKEFEKDNATRRLMESKKLEIINEIKSIECDIKFRLEKIESSLIEKNNFTQANDILRNELTKVNESLFTMDDSKSCCPTCKRSLENASQIESELRENFNKSKVNSINEIQKKGKANKEEIERLENICGLLSEKNISDKLKINSLEEKLNAPELQNPLPLIQIEPTQEMIDLQKEIESIVIPELFQQENSQIQEEIKVLNENKTELTIQLSIEGQIKAVDERLIVLNNNQRLLSQELSKLEKIEMQIEKFNKAKIELIENRINSKFALVKFKMFNEQLNGGESEACECLVNGVPYSDLNTASRINAGLDIINAFQSYFEVSAPVFVDCRESITKLIKTNCQIVSLVVDPNCDELTIIQ